MWDPAKLSQQAKLDLQAKVRKNGRTQFVWRPKLDKKQRQRQRTAKLRLEVARVAREAAQNIKKNFEFKAPKYEFDPPGNQSKLTKSLLLQLAQRGASRNYSKRVVPQLIEIFKPHRIDDKHYHFLASQANKEKVIAQLNSKFRCQKIYGDQHFHFLASQGNKIRFVSSIPASVGVLCMYQTHSRKARLVSMIPNFVETRRKVASLAQKKRTVNELGMLACKSSGCTAHLCETWLDFRKTFLCNANGSNWSFF